MSALGKWLVIAGAVMALVGVGLMVAERLGLGRLPGDIVVRGKNATFHFPIVTSLVVSLVLTLILNVIARMTK